MEGAIVLESSPTLTTKKGMEIELPTQQSTDRETDIL